MANDCLGQCPRFIVAFVNFLLLIECVISGLFGLVILAGLTVYAYNAVLKPSSYLYINMLCLHYEETVSLVIVSWLGVYAGHTKNPRYLKRFALLIFMQGLLSLSLRATINATTDWASMRTVLYKQIRDYQFDLSPNDNARNEATKSWDILQDSLSCCGVQAKYDWMRSSNNSSSESVLNPRLPKSCCEALADGANQDTCRLSDANVHQTGCWQKLAKFYPLTIGPILNRFMKDLILVAMALFLAQSYKRANVFNEGHHHHHHHQKPQDMEASL